jgi:hypothetical protein
MSLFQIIFNPTSAAELGRMPKDGFDSRTRYQSQFSICPEISNWMAPDSAKIQMRTIARNS